MGLISVPVSNLVLAPLSQTTASQSTSVMSFVGNLLSYFAVPVWCVLFLPLSAAVSAVRDDNLLFAFLALPVQGHTNIPMRHHNHLDPLGEDSLI